MPWFGVRLIFAHAELEVFEERITLWQALTIEDAILRAEEEAESYTEHIGAEYVGLAQAYGPLEGEPEDGVEVFSLMRTSTLEPDVYTRQFFATGAERQTLMGDE